MKKLFSKIFNRLVITILLIAIQVVWLIYFFFVLTKHASWINILFTAFSLVMMLYVVNKMKTPPIKSAGSFLSPSFPYSAASYIFLREQTPGPENAYHTRPRAQKNKAFLTQDTAVISQMEPRARATAHYVAKHGVYPVWENTNTQYFPVGEDMYKAMLKELEKAEHYIFLEYFIIARDSMWNNILKFWSAKAAQGVDVRLIYDDMGSVDILPAGYARQMEKKGIKCLAFNPSSHF